MSNGRERVKCAHFVLIHTDSCKFAADVGFSIVSDIF